MKYSGGHRKDTATGQQGAQKATTRALQIMPTDKKELQGRWTGQYRLLPLARQVGNRPASSSTRRLGREYSQNRGNTGRRIHMPQIHRGEQNQPPSSGGKPRAKATGIKQAQAVDRAQGRGNSQRWCRIGGSPPGVIRLFRAQGQRRNPVRDYCNVSMNSVLQYGQNAHGQRQRQNAVKQEVQPKGPVPRPKNGAGQPAAPNQLLACRKPNSVCGDDKADLQQRPPGPTQGQADHDLFSTWPPPSLRRRLVHRFPSAGFALYSKSNAPAPNRNHSSSG